MYNICTNMCNISTIYSQYMSNIFIPKKNNFLFSSDSKFLSHKIPAH